MPVSPCPLVNPHAHEPAERPVHTIRTADPTGLAYSFTIPGEPRSAALACTHVHTALHAHALTLIEDPVLQIAGELGACAALFEPGQDLYLSVHWRDHTIRTTLWDPTPPTATTAPCMSSAPHAASAC